MDCNVVWAKCLEVIRDNINSQSYKTWFEPIKPLKLENQVLTIQVPSQFFYEWIEEHYVALLRRTIRKFIGQDATLNYSVVIENYGENGQKTVVNMPTTHNEHTNRNPQVNMPLSAQKPVPSPFVIPGLKKVTIDSQLNPYYTFDFLIEGECNRTARTAGLSLAMNPGHSNYNPFFVYGGTGLGKTHLIQAIGNEVKRLHPNKIVLYTQAEKFTNEYVDAVKNNTVTEFAEKYNLLDVLIVDDIQFLSNKEKTQETFFSIFNNLRDRNKQIIISSDGPAIDIKGIQERLLSRFKWGLSIDLQPPDLQTRISILKNKMYIEGIEIPDEVTEYIAYNITTNIRELEGAMISIIAQSSFNRKEINLELAQTIVRNFVKNAAREISIEYIQKIVCDYFDINVELLKEKTRKREIVQARQISMYFAKEYTKASLKTIGLHFGNRDHSTVIHALHTVKDLMYTDREFKRYVEEINKKIQLNSA